MKEDMQSLVFGSKTAHWLWIVLEEQLLPIIAKKEGHLKGL